MIPCGLDLGSGHFALIDLADLDAISQHTWRRYVPSKTRTRRTEYAVATIGKRVVYLHLWLWKRWGQPPAEVVDHHDGNGLHCTRENLRPATVAQNNCNRGPLRTNTSGFKGVVWHARDRRWQANISVKKKRVHLGYFKTAEDAARAYDTAALAHHREFAMLNFPF